MAASASVVPEVAQRWPLVASVCLSVAEACQLLYLLYTVPNDALVLL
jgi:hypothetical protein